MHFNSHSLSLSLRLSHTLSAVFGACRCVKPRLLSFSPTFQCISPFFLISPLKVFCEALPNNIRLIVVAAFGFYRLPTFEKITPEYFIILMLFFPLTLSVPAHTHHIPHSMHRGMLSFAFVRIQSYKMLHAAFCC